MSLVLLLCLFLSQGDREAALSVHNHAREAVGVQPLKWSVSLAREAEAYAEYLATSGRFEHSDTDSGENLYWYSAQAENPLEMASRSWCAEISDYRHGRRWHGNFPDIGHYTQMVWHSTREVGIGFAVSEAGETYVVARYHPAGNNISQLPY